MDISRLDLSHARKLAKDLLRSPDTARIQKSHPEFTAGISRPLRLADAQWVIAREAGFDSWPKLKHALERRDATRTSNAAALVEAALDNDLPRVQTLLSTDPTLLQFDFATALVTGNADLVDELLTENPDLARATYSRRNLPPLFLCTRSELAKTGGDDFSACIRRLAAAGCDVNQKVPFEPPYHTSSGTPLYYVAGFHGNRALANTLLELGASPNDGETLYHAIEKHDLELLRLLHPYNRDLGEWSYAFLHLMDYEWIDSAETMLKLGVNLNHRHPQGGETPLHWAVKNQRSPEMITLLLAHGADPGAKDFRGVSAYARAARSGDAKSAAVMERAGYRETLDRTSQLLLAAALEDAAAVRTLLDTDPALPDGFPAEYHAALSRAAAAGRLSAVRGMLRLLQVPMNFTHTTGVTPLHEAALNGHPDVVRLLIDSGARLDIQDPNFQALPVGWACWASENAPFSRRQKELVEIVEMLLQAGGPKPAALWGSPQVREVLIRHGMTP